MLNILNYKSMDIIDYNSELNTIKYIAQENGYNPEMIDTIWGKLKIKHNPTITHNSKKH